MATSPHPARLFTSGTPTRRSVLQWSAVGAVASALAAQPWQMQPAWSSDEFDVLRQRWRDLMTGGDFDPSVSAIADRLAVMNKDAGTLLGGLLTDSGRDRLWADLPIAGGTATTNVGNIGVSYVRLYDLSLAWATKGSALYADEQVAATLVAALRFLHDRGYNASMRVSGNWWFWEIGNPRRLMDSCCLLFEHIPAADLAAYTATVRRFTPNPNYRGTGTSLAETGANRTDKALTCAVRGILSRRADEVALARDALSDTAGGGRNSLFRYVTQGDGFYADGSFVQHGYLPYVGTYGNVTLAGMGSILALLGGSTWDVIDPNRGVILDAPEKSFAPFIWNGLMMETVRGRAVSRERERDYHDGFTTISSMLLLATSLSPDYQSRYRTIARGWIERSPYAYLDTASIPQISRALAVLGDGSVAAAPEPIGHQQFPNQDRAVHRRQGWAFTASISTNRIGRYEWGNNENNLGWYQGDGMTYLYLATDPKQYANDYWPTVNPYRLPGTTISTAPRQSGETNGTGIPRATRPWGGGTSVFGAYGTIGMDHLSWDRSVSARKSWFCLDDAIVALGSGISGPVGHRVETVVENRNIHYDGGATVLVDGSPAVPAVGDTADADSPQWAHIEGVGGYLFPAGGSLKLQREERTGSWRTINSGSDTGGSDTPITRPYLSLWFDHGEAAGGGIYAYAILPGATANGTRSLARSGQAFAVVANTPAVQAISTNRKPGRLLMANFFEAGSIEGLSATGTCSAIAGWKGDSATVAVSDPSRSQTRLELVIEGIHATHTLEADPGVTVLSYSPFTVEVDVTGARGATKTITVGR